MTVSTAQETSDWGSDFFGTLNEMPPEPVGAISGVLEAMSTLPAFRDGRQWVLNNLGLGQGSSIVEAGCGNGAALGDIQSVVGPEGRIAGIDPTQAFVEAALERAKNIDGGNTEYEIGDIRSMPYPDDTFDAAFCDKVLIHAGPPQAALSEMARVTRPSGHVGAIEWLPFFALSASHPELLDAFNGIFKKAMYDYFASCNLARHFNAAGMKKIRTQAFLAHTDSLDSHPFWRAFLINQMPLFVHAELIDEETGQAIVADLEGLDARNEFSAGFIVQAAVGTV